jgi:HSP20 family molecular chaperone IbpA
MAMKERPAREQDKAGTPVKFVPAVVLEQKKNEIQDMIARRAYEIFEYRARVPGHETEDWEQAESELLYPCRHDLKESADAFILHAELPGTFTADQLKVSVEPRRLIVNGEQEISVLFGEVDGTTHSELRSRQIFRMHNLPADVDPSKATATLKSDILEVILPKASTANERSEKANSASSGR